MIILIYDSRYSTWLFSYMTHVMVHDYTHIWHTSWYMIILIYKTRHSTWLYSYMTHVIVHDYNHMWHKSFHDTSHFKSCDTSAKWRHSWIECCTLIEIARCNTLQNTATHLSHISILFYHLPVSSDVLELRELSCRKHPETNHARAVTAVCVCVCVPAHGLERGVWTVPPPCKPVWVWGSWLIYIYSSGLNHAVSHIVAFRAFCLLVYLCACGVRDSYIYIWSSWLNRVMSQIVAFRALCLLVYLCACEVRDLFTWLLHVVLHIVVFRAFCLLGYLCVCGVRDSYIYIWSSWLNHVVSHIVAFRAFCLLMCLCACGVRDLFTWSSWSINVVSHVVAFRSFRLLVYLCACGVRDSYIDGVRDSFTYEVCDSIIHDVFRLHVYLCIHIYEMFT